MVADGQHDDLLYPKGVPEGKQEGSQERCCSCPQVASTYLEIPGEEP